MTPEYFDIEIYRKHVPFWLDYLPLSVTDRGVGSVAAEQSALRLGDAAGGGGGGRCDRREAAAQGGAGTEGG